MFLLDTDLAVYRTPEIIDDAAQLVLTTDYTLTGAEDENGGTLTLVNPIDGDSLIIINDPPITQLTDYPEAGKFPAESHEHALDKLTIICQRANDMARRAVRLEDYDTATVIDAGDLISAAGLPRGPDEYVFTGNGMLDDPAFENFMDKPHVWTKSQKGAITDLTSTAGSIAIDLAATNNFKHTFTEDTTLAAPSNPVEGQTGIIYLTQHASAPKTLAFDAFWYFGATTPTIAAVNGAKAIISYAVEPGAAGAMCAMVGDTI
jgi:hypothetical protein